MGLTEPIRIEAWHSMWIVVRGRETFFDDERVMLTFDTVDEAVEWSIENLGKEPTRPQQETLW